MAWQPAAMVVPESARISSPPASSMCCGCAAPRREAPPFRSTRAKLQRSPDIAQQWAAACGSAGAHDAGTDDASSDAVSGARAGAAGGSGRQRRAADAAPGAGSRRRRPPQARGANSCGGWV
jgi:hypothetical protein